MTMMMTPPSTDSTSRWVRTSCPMAEAAAPSDMNIVAKPSTNATADSITVRRATRSSPSAVNWSSETPAM